MNDLTTDEDFGGRAIREAQDKAREHLAESLVQRKLDEAMEALPTFAAGAIVASDGPYVMLDVPGKPSGGQRVRHRLRPAFARQLAEVLWRKAEEAEKEAG